MPCQNHLENPRESRCALRRPELLFSIYICTAIFCIFCLPQNAAGSTLLGASPTSLSFGSVSVGSSSNLVVTLTDEGGSNIRVSQATVAGPGFSVRGLSLPRTLKAHQKTTFTATFAPTAGGSATGSISIASDADDPIITISLSGTGVTQSAMKLSPASLAFRNQAVGATSTAQTVTLKSTGNSALSISSIALTGANASDFAQTNNCGSSVVAGASCTISVTFKPTTSGTRTAAVTLTDNAAGSPQAVSLTGTGTAAVASLSPTSLTFASQAVGATSAAQTVTLKSTGNSALSISSIVLTGANASDFAQTNNCGSSVAAGANCTISVTFTPAASGTRTAAVTLTDNAAGSPQAVSLAGTGGSAGAGASISPSSLTFGNEPVDTTSSSQVVTLNNTGSAALNITSIAFTGANGTDFTEVDTCSPSVAAGGNCTIAILFTPSAIGTRTASLTITDNASGSPQSVSLSGTGTHGVILSWTASTASGVEGYNVYRGTNSGGESSTPLNSTPTNGTTFTDENVTAGATYYYVVTAIASGGVTASAASNEAAATVPSP